MEQNSRYQSKNDKMLLPAAYSSGKQNTNAGNLLLSLEEEEEEEGNLYAASYNTSTTPCKICMHAT